MGITLKSDKDGTPMSVDAQIFSKNDIEKVETALRILEKDSNQKIGDLDDENRDLKSQLSKVEKDYENLNKRYEKLNGDYEQLYRSHQDLEMKRLLVKNTFSDVGPISRRKSQED